MDVKYDCIDLRTFRFSDEFFHTLERSPANGSLGDDIKPNFHLIEPGSISGRIVNLITWMGREPSFNLRMFMSSVIIDY